MPPKSPPDLTLYSSRISNASARLRIALSLKQLPYKLVIINLSKGEQHNPDFKKLNPLATVPLLVHQHEDPGKKTIIGQSIAAIEYLDEAFPETRLLMPDDAAQRAHIRTLVAVLASDMHPLLTHRVSEAIRHFFPEAMTEDSNTTWNKHWVSEGLRKFEGLLESSESSGSFCDGDEITLADVVLMPEVWFARRIGVDTAPFDRIEKICYELCEIEDVRKEEQTLESV